MARPDTRRPLFFLKPSLAPRPAGRRARAGVSAAGKPSRAAGSVNSNRPKSRTQFFNLASTGRRTRPARFR